MSGDAFSSNLETFYLINFPTSATMVLLPVGGIEWVGVVGGWGLEGKEVGKGRVGGEREKILLMGDFRYQKFLLTGKNILEGKFT